jgi:hypothetical protein
MFNNNNRLETQASRKRYLYGKQIEDKIVKSLESYGLVFEDVDRNTDCVDKIDRFLITETSKKPCQIKCRMGYSGDDILIDIYEPFKGIDNQETQPGRDYVGKYEVYIVLSRDGKTIRVIDGFRQKEIIEAVLKEWSGEHYQLPVFNSKLYPGCQLRYTTDRNNNRPKVLMFINPSVYVVDKEIQLFEMKD